MESKEAILQALRRPMRLPEIAESIGKTPPTTHRQLRILLEEGRVLKEGHHKKATYQLAPYTRIEANIAGTPTTWQTSKMDWRFPLASRISDPDAYQSLRILLEMDLPPCTIWAFGSAIGNPGPKSDLDLMADVDFSGFVDEANLTAPRFIDFHELSSAPPPLQKAAIAHGITVYSNQPEPNFVEALRASE